MGPAERINRGRIQARGAIAAKERIARLRIHIKAICAFSAVDDLCHLAPLKPLPIELGLRIHLHHAVHIQNQNPALIPFRKAHRVRIHRLRIRQKQAFRHVLRKLQRDALLIAHALRKQIFAYQLHQHHRNHKEGNANDQQVGEHDLPTDRVQYGPNPCL